MIRSICIPLSFIFLFSCGSKTSVILLPDEDGKTGIVVVKSQSSSITLNKPYTYTNVSGNDSIISATSIDSQKVKDRYQLLLDSKPLKPEYFILYFDHDSTDLTKASMELVPIILQKAKDRESSEITVIGHTDSEGDSEYNNELALQRAKTIAKLLKDSDTGLKNLFVKSHGEFDPLVFTQDDVSEGLNRRVEIMIR